MSRKKKSRVPSYAAVVFAWSVWGFLYRRSNHCNRETYDAPYLDAAQGKARLLIPAFDELYIFLYTVKKGFGKKFFLCSPKQVHGVGGTSPSLVTRCCWFPPNRIEASFSKTTLLHLFFSFPLYGFCFRFLPSIDVMAQFIQAILDWLRSLFFKVKEH